MIDRRVTFFLAAAVLCALMTPLAPGELRWVPVASAVTYGVLAVLVALESLSGRPRRAPVEDGGEERSDGSLSHGVRDVFAAWSALRELGREDEPRRCCMMGPMTGATRAKAPATVALLPVGPGVYRFRGESGSTLYIGRATNLRARVSSYWGDLGDRKRLARMVAQIARIEAVACQSAHEAAWLERNLLELRRPRWNRAIGGQEVPVFIRLDCGPRSPEVTLVHEHEPQPSAEARHFGPYLGGTKVRLAVSGLRRMLPVGYASEALSGSGRDMARVLGVDPGDREALLGSVVAVLERDPAAVAAIRAALQRRRDAAAQAHAFEWAARLHAEMAAIEWVVAEQHVAVPEPLDLNVYGWAGGVLVNFEMRRGRLCRWEQRLCSEATARRHVATTPPGYADFGRRNAELAARLIGR